MMKRPDEDRLEGDPKITLSAVAAYLGVGRRVVSRLIREGAIRVKKDPLDSRRKIVSVRDLEQLKRQSSKKLE